MIRRLLAATVAAAAAGTVVVTAVYAITNPLCQWIAGGLLLLGGLTAVVWAAAHQLLRVILAIRDARRVQRQRQERRLYRQGDMQTFALANEPGVIARLEDEMDDITQLYVFPEDSHR